MRTEGQTGGGRTDGGHDIIRSVFDGRIKTAKGSKKIGFNLYLWQTPIPLMALLI